jgi:transposase-like protein
MLIYFPSPYPNEDFRSVIFRYHHRSTNIEMSETKKELFEFYSSQLGQFPRNLSSLLKKLPTEKSNFKEEFLSHTWYLLFKPFLTKERLSIVEMDILYGNEKSRVGKVSSQRNTPVLSKTIRYCIKCMQEDENKYGEVYAHLEHQIDFLDFCPIHLIKLNNRCPDCNTAYSDTLAGVLAIKPCCNSNYQRIEENNLNSLKLRLFNEMKFFKKYAGNIGSHVIYSKIIAVLGKNDYIDIRGFIEKGKLIDDLVKHFQLESLNSIGVFPSLIKKNIAYFVNQKHMSKFIVLYFLLIILLKGSVKSWLYEEGYYSIKIPFGNGPWPCYNPLCSSFQLKSIKDCKRTIKRKSSVGRFRCVKCGFVYTLKDYLDNNRQHIKFQLEERGFLWKEKVQELYKSGYGIKQIANFTGTPLSTINDYLRTYKKQMVSFEDEKINKNNNGTSTLIEELYCGSREVSASKEIDIKKIHREKILSLLKSQKGLKRTNVRDIAQSTYLWILRNDKKWFDKVLPPVKQTSLDFKSLDLYLKTQVRNTAQLLIASNPSTRIKQYSILNKLRDKDKSRILSHKNKLPLTMIELSSHIEKLEDYQVRHVPSLVEQLRAAGCVNITLNSIMSFRRSYRNCSEKTKEQIVEVLEEIQNNPNK